MVLLVENKEIVEQIKNDNEKAIGSLIGKIKKLNSKLDAKDIKVAILTAINQE